MERPQHAGVPAIRYVAADVAPTLRRIITIHDARAADRHDGRWNAAGPHHRPLAGRGIGRLFRRSLGNGTQKPNRTFPYEESDLPLMYGCGSVDHIVEVNHEIDEWRSSMPGDLYSHKPLIELLRIAQSRGIITEWSVDRRNIVFQGQTAQFSVRRSRHRASSDDLRW